MYYEILLQVILLVYKNESLYSFYCYNLEVINEQTDSRYCRQTECGKINTV